MCVLSANVMRRSPATASQCLVPNPNCGDASAGQTKVSRLPECSFRLSPNVPRANAALARLPPTASRQRCQTSHLNLATPAAKSLLPAPGLWALGSGLGPEPGVLKVGGAPIHPIPTFPTPHHHPVCCIGKQGMGRQGRRGASGAPNL